MLAASTTPTTKSLRLPGERTHPQPEGFAANLAINRYPKPRTSRLGVVAFCSKTARANDPPSTPPDTHRGSSALIATHRRPSPPPADHQPADQLAELVQTPRIHDAGPTRLSGPQATPQPREHDAPTTHFLSCFASAQAQAGALHRHDPRGTPGSPPRPRRHPRTRVTPRRRAVPRAGRPSGRTRQS